MRKMIAFTLVLGFFQVAICSAQERINRAKLTFAKSSEPIDSAMGYAYNSEIGEWVDYQNVICDNPKYKTEYKALLGPYMMSRNENFTRIQFKSLEFNGSNYYVLMIERWSGVYEYPAIERDWHEYKRTIGFIFSETEYKKISNINGTVELRPLGNVSLGSRYENFDEIKFLDLIQNELGRKKYESDGLDIFPIYKSQEGLIRFRLPSYFNKYFNYDFSKKYFEVTHNTFRRLIIH